MTWSDSTIANAPRWTEADRERLRADMRESRRFSESRVRSEFYVIRDHHNAAALEAKAANEIAKQLGFGIDA